jgi:hypothetical protein
MWVSMARSASSSSSPFGSKGIHEDHQFRGGRRDLKQFYEDGIQSSEKGFEAITNRTLGVCVCV